MTSAPTNNITAENLQEAVRLRRLWDGREVRVSQRVFGAAYKIGGQSAVNQMLLGRLPISLKAAMGFATGLRCQIEDFSPRLAALIATAGAVSGPAPSNPPIDWGDLVKPERPAPPSQQEMLGYIQLVTSTQHKTELFAEFMNRPEIRELVRLLPPADPHDVLMSLLKSAFDRGFDHGASFFAMQMLAGEKLQKK